MYIESYNVSFKEYGIFMVGDLTGVDISPKTLLDELKELNKFVKGVEFAPTSNSVVYTLKTYFKGYWWSLSRVFWIGWYAWIYRRY